MRESGPQLLFLKKLCAFITFFILNTFLINKWREIINRKQETHVTSDRTIPISHIFTKCGIIPGSQFRYWIRIFTLSMKSLKRKEKRKGWNFIWLIICLLGSSHLSCFSRAKQGSSSIPYSSSTLKLTFFFTSHAHFISSQSGFSTVRSTAISMAAKPKGHFLGPCYLTWHIYSLTWQWIFWFLKAPFYPLPVSGLPW